jgi:hypothetical protein
MFGAELGRGGRCRASCRPAWVPAERASRLPSGAARPGPPPVGCHRGQLTRKRATLAPASGREALNCRQFNVSPPLETCNCRQFNASVSGAGRRYPRSPANGAFKGSRYPRSPANGAHEPASVPRPARNRVISGSRHPTGGCPGRAAPEGSLDSRWSGTQAGPAGALPQPPSPEPAHSAGFDGPRCTPTPTVDHPHFRHREHEVFVFFVPSWFKPIRDHSSRRYAAVIGRFSFALSTRSIFSWPVARRARSR